MEKIKKKPNLNKMIEQAIKEGNKKQKQVKKRERDKLEKRKRDGNGKQHLRKQDKEA